MVVKKSKKYRGPIYSERDRKSDSVIDNDFHRCAVEMFECQPVTVDVVNFSLRNTNNDFFWITLLIFLRWLLN